MDWEVFALIILVISIIVYVYGWKKNSQMVLFFSGIAFLTALFYFLGWLRLAPFVPPVSMAIAYFVKKRIATSNEGN
ncbi:hypothetical protein VBD025_16395 [Virgibacillus flavescens]|uniref:hypothetical protein n=1 Tax=Virgibacillus flavescens TaxID=1611422 RepID=UPI003D35334F